MIAKTLLTFCLLLATFQCILGIWTPDQQMWIKENPKQRNARVIQNYLNHQNDSFLAIIVGASVTQRISLDTSLNNILRLGIAGQTTLDCFDVLRASQVSTKFLFVEVNSLFRPETKNYASKYVFTRINEIQKHIPFIRSENRPMTYVLNYVMKHSQLYMQPEMYSDSALNLSLRMMGLMFKQSRKKMVDAHMAKLQDHLAYFRQKGVSIVFYQVPMNPKVEGDESFRYLVNSIKSTFLDCPYMACPYTFKTSDGVHLKAEENTLYSDFFNKEIKKFVL